jgi:hypothetical protein
VKPRLKSVRWDASVVAIVQNIPSRMDQCKR